MQGSNINTYDAYQGQMVLHVYTNPVSWGYGMHMENGMTWSIIHHHRHREKARKRASHGDEVSREFFLFFLVLMQMGPYKKNIMTSVGCDTCGSSIWSYYNVPLSMHEVPHIFQKLHTRECIGRIYMFMSFREKCQNLAKLVKKYVNECPRVQKEP